MGDEKNPRRSGYPEDVRRDAVAMVLELGVAKDEVCARFGMAKGTLNRWISEVRGTAGQGRGNCEEASAFAACFWGRPAGFTDSGVGRPGGVPKKATAFFARLETDRQSSR